MRRTHLAVLAAIATAAAAPAASARSGHVDHSIAFFRSIAGISLGETPSAVRAQLGAPKRTTHFDDGSRDFDYAHNTLTVEFGPRGKVDFIDVFSPAYHGPRGVRVGAPWSKAKQVYDGAPCGTLSFQCTFSFIHQGVMVQHGKTEMSLGFTRRHGGREISVISLSSTS